jgi:hypothetical protein
VPTDFARQLERELAEAKFDLQFRRELYALQTKELGEAREQRDRLAEASLFLADVAEKNTDDTDLWNAAIGKVRELAAVKGATQ